MVDKITTANGLVGKRWAWSALAIADALAVIAFLKATPWLSARLDHPHWLNAVIVAVAYLLMCVGIVLGKMVKPAVSTSSTPDKTSDRYALGCTLALSFFYIFFVAAMFIDAGGVFDPESGWDKLVIGNAEISSVLTSVGVIVGFIVLGLFPWALLHEPRRVWARWSGVGFATRLVSAMLVNIMVLVTAAYWNTALTGESLDIALGGKLLLFTLMYIVFWLFYAPPRLALISLESSSWSLISFAILLAIMTGQLIW